MKRFRAGLSKIWGVEKGRPVAIILLVVFALIFSFPDLQPFKSARLALFDQYQIMSPRQPQSQPVVIVEIDEATLGALGQWPWPRNYFAALIDAIAALKPAAVGLDIIMPEADHASPQALAESRPDLPEDVRKTLVAALSNDKLLAASFAGVPIVLGAAGFMFPTSETQAGLRTNAIEVRGDNPLTSVNTYPYVLASLPEFQSVARGQALLSSDPENGIVRRAAMLSIVSGALTPGLSLEMMRVAHDVPHIVVESGRNGIKAVNIGTQPIALQDNGEAWIHFDALSHQRSISALSLLKNEVPSERIRGKMVLVGLTGLGLQDMITTPLGDRRSGVEVHAQLIEGFEAGHFLTRPGWLHWVELGVMLSGGMLLVWLVPNTKPLEALRRQAAIHSAEQQSVTQATPERRSRNRPIGVKPKLSALLAIFLLVSLFGSGFALFHWADLLFDAASLFIALGVVFCSLLFSVFIESGHQRKSAEFALQNQRLKAAQLTGELDAARRIQLGTLPSAVTAFPGEKRFEIDAMLEPARQVGGDLYDFFMIDTRRLFFIIGDVSGKGLPASLFMVVTKALGKSAALREIKGIGEIIGKVISMANMEMARENPEMLFVTAVAGILDVENGALELVNAGHDAPWLICVDGTIKRVNGDGGPPLCVLDDFVYPVQHVKLAKGETLLLLTDGITEAMNAHKQLYGMERVRAVLNNAVSDPRPGALLSDLREDVRAFVGNTEPSDDLTLLVLRWQGPVASGTSEPFLNGR